MLRAWMTVYVCEGEVIQLSEVTGEVWSMWGTSDNSVCVWDNSDDSGEVCSVCDCGDADPGWAGGGSDT